MAATNTTTTRFDFINEDRRIVEQRLRRHQLSPQDYQRLLKNLPDEKEYVDEIKIYREAETTL